MTDSRTRATSPLGGSARRGFTLIETGFVIGLLGLLSLMASYVYIEGIEQEAAEQQDEGTVQDIYSIIDALRAYATGANTTESWPTYDRGCLHLRALARHGYLRTGSPMANNDDWHGLYDRSVCESYRITGPTRYTTCGTNRSARCSAYTFHRWNPRTSYGRSSSSDITHFFLQFGNSVDLNKRIYEHGARNFHLLIFFGFPGDYGNEADRARAQALADRLPNAVVRDSGFSNEMYIFLVLFHESTFIRGNQQYIRLDGEDRPVIFRPGRGVLGGIQQLAIDDEPSVKSPQPRAATPASLNSGYPRIRFFPPDPPGRNETRVLLMADDTDQQDEAAVTFDHFFDAKVEFTVADRLASQTGSDITVPHHSLTFGTGGFQARPSLVLRRRTSSNLSDFGVVLRMLLRERRLFTGTYDWDIDLVSSSSHNSLRTRLCALERSTDRQDTDAVDPVVPPDITCP